MQATKPLRAIQAYYFDTDTHAMDNRGGDLSFIGTVGGIISFALAFFTLGITNTAGERYVSLTFVAIGAGCFVVGAILHFSLWVLGTFYKMGVWKCLKLTSIILSFLASYVATIIVVIGGGTAVILSAFVLTPSWGVFSPFKFLAVTSVLVWWLVQTGKVFFYCRSVKNAFSLELWILSQLKAKATNRLSVSV